MEHTPGPWKTDDVGQIHAFERGLVAKALPRDGDADQYNVELANARLIAAAPELLAALERILLLTPEITELEKQAPTSIAKARAAIAKAKGKESV